MRVPGAVLDALRARSKTLQGIGTHDPTAGVLNTREGAIAIRGETVSANFVDVFGVSPVRGRGFVADDERPGAPAVMLVSSGFWRQYLGSDPNAVGCTVYLDAVPYSVVGIMPPQFRTRFESSGPEFWTVYAGNVSRVRERELGYELVARLSRGVTIEQARREVDAIASGVHVDGWREAGRRIGLVPLKEEVVGNRANALTLLMAAVAVVLAIACASCSIVTTLGCAGDEACDRRGIKGPGAIPLRTRGDTSRCSCDAPCGRWSRRRDISHAAAVVTRVCD